MITATRIMILPVRQPEAGREYALWQIRFTSADIYSESMTSTEITICLPQALMKTLPAAWQTERFPVTGDGREDPSLTFCGTQAPYYVKRNFQELFRHGIKLDCAYLDVFTCNEGDECSNPMHRMTRKECYEYRCRCFDYLLKNGILSSSEEVNDWAVPSQIFCHYAPYDFMMEEPGTPKQGIPVPLYNLVYHDCVIQPG